MNRRTFISTVAIGPAAARLNWALPQAAPLAERFADPPDSARPWVYWFWINGNITREGITADLEAMQRVGVGGVLIMEVDGTPQGDVPFGSPRWREHFRFACEEASRLGLEINMHNTAGWAGSAGPWITPELSMQKVVWSETVVRGGGNFEGVLPQSAPAPALDYYRDIAVVAIPAPENDSYRIPDIELKASYLAKSTPPGALTGIPFLPITHASLPVEARVDPARIQDLTGRVREGRLSWDAPPGKWIVFRFGHTSTGQTNHPTPPAGSGLECDKLSRGAIELHFSKLIADLVSRVGPLAGKTLVATHIDSWEVGSQNWTAGFRAEFRKRCGYDIVPFLPVMAGRVIGDLETSERFLWDLRKTISDLVAENYAGRLRELAQQHGLRLSIEGYDGDPLDEMTYAGQADEPQTEFWYGGAGKAGDFFPGVYRSYSWVSNMVSAAHVYGKRIIAAEAFTAMPGEDWLAHPALLKPLGDWALCQGINRFIFHRYAMQPWVDDGSAPERKPGMTMAAWGVHYERTQTWWEESKPWHEYLTRCQLMLREGLFVADLLYLQPEGAPMRFMPPGVDMTTPVPPDTPGYNFDGCTPEVLLKRASISNGRIQLPDGMSYRLLVLPAAGEQPTAGLMTPELLKRIAALVNEGMTVVGPPPLKSPSLTNYPDCDRALAETVDSLWGNIRNTPSGERRVGKGRVIWGRTPQQVLAADGVPPDFSCGSPAAFRYIHRRTEDGSEVYFVANKENRPVEATCTFRVSGRGPEFWRPEDGKLERAVVYDEKDGTTSLPVGLDEYGSVFVVFRKTSGREAGRVVEVVRNGAVLTEVEHAVRLRRREDGKIAGLVSQAGSYRLKTASGRQVSLDVPEIPEPIELQGPWEVQFSPNRGAPPREEFRHLISWSEHPVAGVRHFSGKATYRKSFRLPAPLLSGERNLVLDLGEVQVIARVKLNGRDLGILWRQPFRIDVTGAVRPGGNLLEVTVVNLWPNRLIGLRTCRRTANGARPGKASG